MIDWKHNGKHDAFDIATDVTLMNVRDRNTNEEDSGYSCYAACSAKPEIQENESKEEPEEIKPWQMRLTGFVFFYFLLYPLFWMIPPIREFMLDLGYTGIAIWLGLAFVLANFISDLIYREEKKNAKEDCKTGGDIMTETYTTLQIPFTEEEVQFIDNYAAQNGETREELLHRMFQNVLADIRSKQ